MTISVSGINGNLYNAIYGLNKVSFKVAKISDSIAKGPTYNNINSNIDIYKSILQNVAQTKSMLGVAESGTNQISSILSKLKELSVSASSPLISPEQRGVLSNQFQQLLKQIDNVVDVSSFNGQKLLDGSFSEDKAMITQVGIKADNIVKIPIKDFTVNGLFGKQNLSIATVADALNSFNIINDVLVNFQQSVAETFSYHSQLDSAAKIASSNIEGSINAYGKSMTDLTEEISALKVAKVNFVGLINVIKTSNEFSNELLNLIK